MTRASQPTPATPPARPQAAGTYIYCVGSAQPFISGGPLPSVTGIGNSPVRLVRSGELVAVVSDSPLPEYEITDDSAMAHERVVDAAMTHATVLPMRFGTVAESDVAIQEELLRGHHDELARELDAVRGCAEFGLKVLWEHDHVFSELLARDSEIKGLSDAIAGTTTEQTYYERIQLGEAVEAALQQRREQETAAIMSRLRPLAVDVVENQLIDDMMVLNAAFLVAQNQVAALRNAVDTLRQSEAGRLIIKFAGPFAPYNFVRLTEAWQGAMEESADELSR